MCNMQKQPPECSVKKGVLRNFAKFTGKHLCQSLFFNKVVGLKIPQVFSCKFCDIYKNTFSTEHLWTTAFKYGQYFTRFSYFTVYCTRLKARDINYQNTSNL